MASGRAVVLGVGGIGGVAWLAGLLATVREAGGRLDRADLVVGTSAGALMAARLAGGADMRREVRLLAGPRSPVRRLLTGVYRLAPTMPAGEVNDMLAALDTQAPSTPASRRESGAQALAARTMPEWAFLAFVGVVVRRMRWPDTPLLMVCADAHTGGRRPVGRGSGVTVVRAAAASAAVPRLYPPVRLDGRPCIDGGTCSALNADLAAGHGRVLVVTCHLPTEGAGPLSRAQVDAEVAALRAGGAEAVLVEPDEASREPLMRALDPAAIVPAAQAGVRQGRRGDAARILAAWGR